MFTGMLRIRRRKHLATFGLVCIIMFLLYEIHQLRNLDSPEEGRREAAPESRLRPNGDPPKQQKLSKGAKKKSRSSNADDVAWELIEKYRLAEEDRLPLDVSPWQVAGKWVNPREIIPDFVPELDSLAAKGSNELTNEDILQLQNYLTQKNLKFSMMVMWITQLLSSNYDEKHLSSTLKKLVIENRIKRKNKTQRPQELQQFCTSPFHERVTLSSQVKSPDESNDSATIEHPPASKIKALEESVKKYQNKLSDMRTAFRLLTAKYETVSKQKPSLLNQNVHVKNVIARLRMEVSKQSIDRQKKLTKSKLYKLIYMLKQMNKKRLSENNELKKQVNSLKEIQVKLKAEKVSLQKTTSLLKRKCKKLRNEKTSRDEAIQQILEKNKKEVRATRDSWCNRFNDNVRMTIIGLQVAGISASKCSQVIDIF